MINDKRVNLLNDIAKAKLAEYRTKDRLFIPFTYITKTTKDDNLPPD